MRHVRGQLPNNLGGAVELRKHTVCNYDFGCVKYFGELAR